MGIVASVFLVVLFLIAAEGKCQRIHDVADCKVVKVSEWFTPVIRN